VTRTRRWALCFTRPQTGVYVVLLLDLRLERICAFNCDRGDIRSAEWVVRRRSNVLRSALCYVQCLASCICFCLPCLSCPGFYWHYFWGSQKLPPPTQTNSTDTGKFAGNQTITVQSSVACLVVWELSFLVFRELRPAFSAVSAVCCWIQLVMFSCVSQNVVKFALHLPGSFVCTHV
jgi:hypothetical protein